MPASKLATAFVLALVEEKSTPLNFLYFSPSGGGGVTPYSGLYREAPPKRGVFLKPTVY